MNDPTAALLEAMRNAWPSHTEGSGGTHSASTFWQVLDPALPSAPLAVAIYANLPPGWFLPDSLDAAWAEARAAADALFGEPIYIALAGPEPRPDGSLTYRAECGVEYAVRGHPTPAAALHALTAKLREARG